MNVTLDKKKVEGLDKKWLVFFEKNLNKFANLEIRRLARTKQWKGSSGMTAYRSWLCCCKDSKLMYFQWTVLDFVSEIVLNLFLWFTRKLFHKFLFNFLGEILLIVSQEIVNFQELHWKTSAGSLQYVRKFRFFKKCFFLDFPNLGYGELQNMQKFAYFQFLYIIIQKEKRVNLSKWTEKTQKFDFHILYILYNVSSFWSKTHTQQILPAALNPIQKQAAIEVFCKKVFLEISQNSQETPVPEPLF